MCFIPASVFLDSTFDFITLSLIAALLLLSSLSLCFIFFLCFKSRYSRHLQNFNSLWTVRFLLILFITLWTINELSRFRFSRWHSVFPFLPSLSLSEQADLCKIHVVLSLGFFQPGFLVTLLFLVNVSIKKRNPRCSWALAFIFSSCLPVLILQLVLLVFSQLKLRTPELVHRSWVVSRNNGDEETVLCAYPLVSTVVFAAFVMVYSVSFFFSCWRALSLVINKSLRMRIYALAFTVLITLPVEIVFLGLSVLWRPERNAFQMAALVVFLSTWTCAAVGEGILIIRPIADSLAAGREGGDERCMRNIIGEGGKEFDEIM